MIAIERLTKTFPERSGFTGFMRSRAARRVALDDISLFVRRGELLGLLGGCGG